MTEEGFPRRFGPYVLAKPLARGGMGALYLAISGQAGMEKLCVVKTALPHLADRSYLQRFRDEAKVVVRLSHGNLVGVFDAGEVKGELFLAMEFIEGRDLRAVWNRCAQKGVAFPIPVAAHIVKELVRGLGYAHAFEGLSLVHRDVSPPNLLLSYSGEVKLTDFGLATSTLKLEKTAPGVIYGKVSYMAPEQARGEPLDARTDLYTAGIILWELLTGRQLFSASSPAPAAGEDDLLERVREPQVVPPSRRATRVPPALDAICIKALAIDPANRYQTGEELRSDLAAFLAKAAPSTDGAQVAQFLSDLFGEEIAKERAERETLIKSARRLLASPSPAADRKGENQDEPFEDDETTIRRTKQPEEVAAEVSQIVGTVLSGRYHIKRLCGEGGMGRVYEAEHVEIGKRVAVKVLHPAYTRTPDVVERFRREARAASKIEHPNVVNVTDSGTTGDGSFFFVMEYIEGVELGYVIHRDGRLPVRRTLRIAAQVCDALQAAHGVGVIHRDLKPENILLVNTGPRSSSALPRLVPGQTPPGDPTGQPAGDIVKVLDFGIAKSAEMEESAKVGRRLTRPGVAMGTPEYMAPEQAAGRPADPRSDIYAVGSIVYEMLAGAPPYEGENVMEVLHKKANHTPPALRELRPDIPSVVEGLVNRAMARLPEARPQSMGEMAEEIRAVLARVDSEGAGIEVLSPSPDMLVPAAVDLGALSALRLPRRAIAVGAALLTILGFLVIVRAARTPPAAPPAVSSRPSAAGAGVPGPPPGAAIEEAPLPPAAPVPAEDPLVSEPKAATAPALREEAAVRRPTAAPPADNGELLKKGRQLLTATRYDEAREVFTKLLSSRRERDSARVGLGQIAFQQGQYYEAVRHAQAATRGGGNVEAWVLLGDAFYKQEKFEEAKRAYSHALKQAPANDTARRGLQAAARRAP